MKNLPPRDRHAVATSLFSPHGRKLWEKMVSPRSRELAALERAFRTERARLVTPAKHRIAMKLVREFATEWQGAALKAGSDLDRRQELKVVARRRLERLLGRAIPGFRAYSALRKKYLKDREKIMDHLPTPAGVGRLGIHLGPIVEPFAVEMQEFVAPFTNVDVRHGGLDEVVKEDDSYVLPETGQLVQLFLFEHDESEWIMNSFAVGDQLTSAGVEFTLPNAGRLQVVAELENFANRLNCSVSDNFGFSHTYLWISVNLFIAIVRAGLPFEYHFASLIYSHLSSEGDDLMRSISDLPTFQPYGVGGVTLSTLPEGETVTVLAGAHVRVDSDTNDMDVQVQASFWWHLRKLAIGVI